MSFEASSNFVVTSCASPAVQENSWSLRVDHRKSLRFGSCYLPNANLVWECWFDPPWKVDSIPVLACTCFFFSTLRLHFLISQKTATVTVFGSSQSCGHGGHVMRASPLRQRLRPAWVIPRIWPRHGGCLGPKRVQVGMLFFCWGCLLQVIMKSMVTSVMYLSPTPSGGHGFSLVAKSFWRFLYWYFFQLLLVAGESCHQEHSRLVAEGAAVP